MIDSAATQSATVREATPAQTDTPSPFMRVSGTASSRQRVFLDLERVVEVGGDASAASVTLHLFKGAAWDAGTHTVTVEPVDEAWDASSVNWTNQPAVRTPSATVVVPAAGSAGDEVTVDITAMLQASLAENNAEGSRWYGVRLTLDTSIEGTFYSAFADADVRPYISLDPIYPPHAPDELKPSDGRAVSKVKPTFMATFNDDEADDYITGIHLQIDDADDFETTTYDSTEVAHDEPVFDGENPPSGATAFSALSTGVTHYWRMKVRDRHNVWSPWSESASFTIVAHGALSITSPTITADEIDTPVPTITLSFTGTQETAHVWVEHRNGDVIETWYEFPLQVTSATSFTVPDDYALDFGGELYRIVARVSDDESREDMRGDRSFVEAFTGWFSVVEP